MSDTLAKLFGSANRVKIIRLFLLNPGEVLTSKDISRRAKVLPRILRRELCILSSIGFIYKKKKVVQDGLGRHKGKRIEGWGLNSSFSLLASLKKLVLNTAPLSRQELLKKIMKVGRIKLVILAGIFIQEENSRVDILVVGDNIRRSVLERALREIEAEVGKELDYAVFSTKDFFYRLNIYDKFIRDILDYSHEKVLNKLDI